VRIGLIGYRNHAARMLRLAAQLPQVRHVRVFHPDIARLAQVGARASDVGVDVTDQLADLHGFDAVVIASPNETHVPYLRDLLGKVGYLLCEKPPGISRAELDWLRGLDVAARRRVAFDFNYAQTALAGHLRQRIADGALGSLAHAGFFAGHGLAFKAEFRDNWRLQNPSVFSSIVGNLGIHYIHLALSLFGEVTRAAIHRASLAGTGAVDTATIVLTLASDRLVEIVISYATPYINTARVVFTDGIVVLDDGRVREYAPRESFDADGRFATPPARTIHESPSSKAYYDASILRVIQSFVATVATGDELDEADFERAVRSAELVLDLESGGHAHRL
jgi:predicted dehydrogenase